MGFAIHQDESAMGTHMSPHPEPHFLSPSPPHPSGLSQSPDFGCSASCIELALVIYFTHSINSVCMSIPIAQFLLLPLPSFFKKNLIYLNWKLITLQYCSGFCHILTWISHGVTCVPHLESPSHLPPHPIPLGHPSAPALSYLNHL